MKPYPSRSPEELGVIAEGTRSIVENCGNLPVLSRLSCSRFRIASSERLWDAEPGPVDDKCVSHRVLQGSSVSLSVG